jgi:hypothetical protein
MQVGELHLGQAEIIEAVRQASKESGWRETNGRTDGRRRASGVGGKNGRPQNGPCNNG